MAFHKPGPNKRVCAFCIDSMAGQILGGLASFIIANEIGWLIWIIFIVLRDCVNGQSIGKLLVGTQVVDDNGQPASATKTIIRNIFIIIPLFPLIEYVSMRLDRLQARRIGDKVAKTKVHDLNPQLNDNNFLWISIGLLLAMALLQLGITALLLKRNPTLLD